MNQGQWMLQTRRVTERRSHTAAAEQLHRHRGDKTGVGDFKKTDGVSLKIARCCRGTPLTAETYTDSAVRWGKRWGTLSLSLHYSLMLNMSNKVEQSNTGHHGLSKEKDVYPAEPSHEKSLTSTRPDYLQGDGDVPCPELWHFLFLWPRRFSIYD